MQLVADAAAVPDDAALQDRGVLRHRGVEEGLHVLRGHAGHVEGGLVARGLLGVEHGADAAALELLREVLAPPPLLLLADGRRVGPLGLVRGRPGAIGVPVVVDGRRGGASLREQVQAEARGAGHAAAQQRRLARRGRAASEADRRGDGLRAAVGRHVAAACGDQGAGRQRTGALLRQRLLALLQHLRPHALHRGRRPDRVAVVHGAGRGRGAERRGGRHGPPGRGGWPALVAAALLVAGGRRRAPHRRRLALVVQHILAQEHG
mmetsp:Transcript_63430/g.163222  ORF Transcript_63430/g.163222 Transcript_63430/m.163222 type:complete len:264 (+) Transcript_63430:810-1601(+)